MVGQKEDKNIDFSFLKKVQNLGNATKDSTVSSLCRQLYEKYISTDSQLELNISSTDRKKFSAFFEDAQQDFDFIKAYSLLNEAQNCALTNIGDSYLRFVEGNVVVDSNSAFLDSLSQKNIEKL